MVNTVGARPIVLVPFSMNSIVIASRFPYNVHGYSERVLRSRSQTVEGKECDGEHSGVHAGWRAVTAGKPGVRLTRTIDREEIKGERANSQIVPGLPQ